MRLDFMYFFVYVSDSVSECGSYILRVVCIINRFLYWYFFEVLFIYGRGNSIVDNESSMDKVMMIDVFALK